MHIVNSCANDLEHTEWSKLLNVHTLKTSRREHLARRRLSVRYAQPLESKLKLFAESAAFSYAENV